MSMSDDQDPIPERFQDDDEIIDFQARLLKRIKFDMSMLEMQKADLLDNARNNMNVTERTHLAVLRLMEAKGLGQLLEVVTGEWPEIMDTDVVSISMEGEDNVLPREATKGVFVIPPGTIDQMMGEGVNAALFPDPMARDLIYGPAAPMVQSDALVRLTQTGGAPAGLLAFGSGQAGTFQPGMGTDLIEFLGDALVRMLRLWLDLP